MYTTICDNIFSAKKKRNHRGWNNNIRDFVNSFYNSNNDCIKVEGPEYYGNSQLLWSITSGIKSAGLSNSVETHQVNNEVYLVRSSTVDKEKLKAIQRHAKK